MLRYLALLLASSTLVFSQPTQKSNAAHTDGAKNSSTPAASVFTDWKMQEPGRVHHITVHDLPAPNQQNTIDNGADVVPRPSGAMPKAPAGFVVELYASGLENPRLLRTAPNGDVFLAESYGNEIKVFRGVDANGKAKQSTVFAQGLTLPFGIAFYPPGNDPQWVYVANTDSVVRFPYRNGDLQARGAAEVVVKQLPGFGRLRGGGHWTRDIAFSLDGKKMYVSIGSKSNVDDTDNNPQEENRADILEFNIDVSGQHVYAWGIRNPVGIAVHPETGELWTSVNERDEIGDNTPPDYITHVTPGGFYGWPWWYMGPTQDPRHKGKHPELREKVITPDVLLQPHNASLQLMFYQGQQFPARFHGGIFAAEHGSWNKHSRTGYEVIFVPLKDGKATGKYEDFLTGFVTQSGKVWGRPVGVAAMNDGSLLVSDDGSKSIWRVTCGK